MLSGELGWIAISMGIGAFGMACSSPVTTAGDADGGSEAGSRATTASVLEYHLHPTRDGAYIDANVTKTAAAKFHMASGFPAKIAGTMYADPLYVVGWKTGQDAIFAVTDQNHVTALDATSGAQLWDVALGPAVKLANLPCMRTNPIYGVMATPVIDLPSRTLYVESFQTINGTTEKHYVYALSIDDGNMKRGWPVDIGAKLTGFDASHENDRGGLTILDGILYLPYASVNGDCDTYHGYVVGISTTDPTQVRSYSPPAAGGGIWSAVSSDGSSLFAVTGNTGIGTTTWSGGEALLRFAKGPEFSKDESDYFVPSNWQALDDGDYDLGSTPAILFDMPNAKSPHLAVAMGKFGVVHLLDRDNLGGVGKGDGTTGEGLVSMAVTTGPLYGTGAMYTTAKGRYIVLRTNTTISVCPNGMSGDLLALTVTDASPPKLVPAWCATSGGQGSPIATTTDGTSNALVWIVSTGGANRLLAFDGDTGAAVFGGGGTAEQMGEIKHWVNPIDANGRLIVGGPGAVYSFTTQ
jgi:hypothetical protein